MKILCVARNYNEHAAEMGAAAPAEPWFFLKPDSSILPKKQPFFYPDFSNEVHFEGELVVRIDKVGKCIQECFAPRYYSSVAFGIDFTARDLQSKAKASSMPWLVSKGFDGSAVIGDFVPLQQLGGDINNLTIQLRQNDVLRQSASTSQMIFSVDKLISYISRFMTLKTGDLIFTGTPSGVGPVAIGDTLEGFVAGQKMLHCRFK